MVKSYDNIKKIMNSGEVRLSFNSSVKKIEVLEVPYPTTRLASFVPQKETENIGMSRKFRPKTFIMNLKDKGRNITRNSNFNSEASSF
mmetsp:Transcript_29610/g.26202  ORF Transcript_29610/g.26202 Transcript_29610/m.26202 type:complete len:88 (+) Transcript_29610:454-717(+)